MENYQMLLPPCSTNPQLDFPISSTSSTSASTMESSQGFTMNAFYGHHHHIVSSNNGFLGLKISHDNNGGEGRDVSHHQHQHQGDYVESSDHIDEEGGKKKKGEKKIRKARCAFQTRSQVDILDDGYRWRKYGQKAVKNNKFPRSYYRCTYQGCNVKKQVQRLTRDEGVVVTTYEGIHSHPIDKPTDNFEHILNQMQIYTPF